MKSFLTLIVFTILTFCAKAQTQPFGKIDTSDLKMTKCDFEKDANAMVLFDKADVSYKFSTIIMLRHKRIKIFNDKGNNEASIRIEFFGAHRDEEVSEIEAQTINMTNNVIEYTAVDKKLIYTEVVDNNKRAIVFTFPNIKPGSVIEFKYKWHTPYAGNFPDWYFQELIPTRYSELQASFSNDFTCKIIRKVSQKFAKDTSVFLNGRNHNQGDKFIWALSNVHSLKEEPYMTSMKDNIERMLFQISLRERTWLQIANNLIADNDFGKQLNIKLNNEEEILAKANALQTTDQKIAFIFNQVKDKVVWNKLNNSYTDQGIEKTWNKKLGNSTEINLILYHLLKQAGINVYPVVINTNGKIDPSYASTYQLDKTIDYIKIDSTKQYVLDATDKYNIYNEVPFDLLNSNGLYLDAEKKFFRIIQLQSDLPSRKLIFVNAEIKPDGKISGTSQINSFSYNRISDIKRYKKDGEKKYLDYLRDNDNNLKISSLKLENMEVDSLPLEQYVDFNLELPNTDENYIYFNPNLFTGLYTNPFLSEDRFSDIDFGCLKNYNINGRYKIPSGYKINALPKSMNMLIPDKSISFKRIVAEQEGYIIVHYVIDFKKSFYAKDDYPDVRAFYKKMQEMLNEQIVLKKS
ncbi:MAG: hypothetical protein JWP37_3569 [Mucilaginibacter sp.]|nr:hypothetical protein [Mucilaginibacter sp.]